MKVKICGITRLEDAVQAIEAGADLLGFNFYPPSPRCIEPERCREIVAAVQARGLKAGMVGVFVNASLAEIQQTLEHCRLHIAQLSGDEDADTLRGLEGRGYKALRPKDAADLEEMIRRYPLRSFRPAWLVDAYRPGEYGGTGQTADWSLAASLARRSAILLAGGLTPDNVAAAIAQVQPWGVDVASGVESAPGIKDPDLMSRFIHACNFSSEGVSHD